MAKLAKPKTPDILDKLMGPARVHLGIDVGTHAIKIVELRTTPRGMDLVHHAIASTPPGGFQVSVVACQLKEMIQERSIKTKQAVVGIAGKGVATRRLSLAKIPEEEMQEAIRREAEELFPFSLGNAMLAFRVVSKEGGEGKTRQDVLVAAATRETIMEHIQVLEQAGLEPVGLLSEPHAVEQFWRSADLGQGEEGSIAVLDLGAHKSSIHIFHGGELQFSRYVPTSGNAFTMALTGMIRAGEQEIELNTAQAENLKRQYGIPSPQDRGKTAEGIPLSQVAVRIRPVLEKLETEISRSFDYYAFQFQGETITRILLTGGGAQLKGIESFVADRFDLRVGILDPLAPIIIQDSPAFSELDAASRTALTVATGLGLPLAEHFNLLPVELQPHRKRWNVRAPVAYATLGLLFLLPLGQYAWQSHRQMATLRNAVNIKKTNLEQYTYIFNEYERLKAENSQLDAKLGQMPRLDFQIPELTVALRIVSHTIPEDMSLTQMDAEELEEGKLGLKMHGLIYGQKEEAFPMLTKFMEELDKSRVFSDVQLESAEEEGAPRSAVLAFKLKSVLK